MVLQILSLSTDEISVDYELGRRIGKGSFGVVHECVNRHTGQRYACKTIYKSQLKDDVDVEDVKREIRLMKQLAGHAHIVDLRDVYEDRESVYLIMELCQGGDLFDEIKERGPLPEKHAMEVFAQIASAVAYCHVNSIMHRDLKPENVLFVAASSNQSRPSHVKLADFGLALVLRPGETGAGLTGSRYYTAPEMVRGKRYGKRADVWSLGVVLCTMLTARLPFAGKTHEDDEGLKKSILRGRINFDAAPWQPVSELAKDLIRQMLVVDPRKRLKAQEVLEHPWLQKALLYATSHGSMLKQQKQQLLLHPALPGSPCGFSLPSAACHVSATSPPCTPYVPAVAYSSPSTSLLSESPAAPSPPVLATERKSTAGGRGDQEEGDVRCQLFGERGEEAGNIVGSERSEERRKMEAASSSELHSAAAVGSSGTANVSPESMLRLPFSFIPWRPVLSRKVHPVFPQRSTGASDTNRDHVAGEHAVVMPQAAGVQHRQSATAGGNIGGNISGTSSSGSTGSSSSSNAAMIAWRLQQLKEEVVAAGLLGYTGQEKVTREEQRVAAPALARGSALTKASQDVRGSYLCCAPRFCWPDPPAGLVSWDVTVEPQEDAAHWRMNNATAMDVDLKIAVGYTR